MTWNDAAQQVLTRLAEDATSPIAALPAGTGTSASDTITSTTQILTYLDEGQKLLARTPLFQVQGTATVTVSDGDRSTLYSAFNPAVSGQVPWRLLRAKLGSSPLKIADPEWRAVYYPDYATAGIIAFVFDAGDRCFYGPVPSTGNGGTLTVDALMLPPTAAAGGTSTVPDHLMHYVIAFGCYRVCEQNAAEPGLAAQLPLWRGEVAKWASELIGVSGGR